MIATLRGALYERTDDGAVVEAAGVGYAIHLSAATRDRLPAPGGEVFLHVVESVAMYGGGVSLYGFISVDEKRIFLALKENVPGAGAKKALELLDKAAKSLPDFRRAIIDKDPKSLVTLFGFTAKTAEKIVAGLQDKMDALPSSGPARGRSPDMTVLNEAIQGLMSLGYRDADARDAAQAARKDLGLSASAEALIRDCLRRLSGRGLVKKLFFLLLVLLAAAAAGAWMDWNGIPIPGLAPRLALPSLPAGEGIELTPLEKALPPGAFMAAGGASLAEPFKAFGASAFHGSFQTFLSGAAPPGGPAAGFAGAAVQDLLSRRFALALYPPERDGKNPGFVFIAALSTAAARTDPFAGFPPNFPPRPFRVERVGDVLLAGNDPARLDAAKAALSGPAKAADNLLVRAAPRVPRRSQVYYALDVDAFPRLGPAGRPAPFPSAFPQPISWMAAGLRYDGGLWTDVWMERRAGLGPDASLSQPPRAGRFSPVLARDSLLMFSAHVPIQSLAADWEKALAVSTPSLALNAMRSWGKWGDFSPQEVLPLLHDEYGFFIHDWPADSPWPPVGAYVRVKSRLKAWFMLWRFCKPESGWRREGTLFLYRPSGIPMLDSLDMACTLRGDILVVGLKPAVAWAAAAPAPGSSPLPPVFSALSPPAEVSSLYFLDLARIAVRAASAAAKFGRFSVDQKSVSRLFSWIPPSAAYSVNGREGVLSRGFWPLRDRPAPEWDDFFRVLRDFSAVWSARAAGMRAFPPPSPVGRGLPAPAAPAAPPPTQTKLPWESVAGLLDNEDWMVRRDAVTALGDMGDVSQAALIQKALKDKNADVRRAAQAALDKLGKKRPAVRKKR